MRTEPISSESSSSSVLFLFAHQDDEFGVFHQIETEVKSGVLVHCAYVTSGVSAGADATKRNMESRNVLESLGIDSNRILFQGEKLNIPDGQALEYIATLGKWLHTWTQQHQPLKAIYVPAWEGGHPDHDILHAVTLQTMQNGCYEATIWQYPLYNSNGLGLGLFRVLTPLPMNGDALLQHIPWSSRWRYLRLCLSYVSQTKSWLGLFPFVLWHYLTRGYQSLQPICHSRLLERPHPGQLYYEFRGFAEWGKVLSRLRQNI
jgi:hypothetical protein